MGVWAIFRIGFWPLVLLLAYAVASLIGCVTSLSHQDIDSVGISAILGTMVIYLAILLNAVVGLKFRNLPVNLNPDG